MTSTPKVTGIPEPRHGVIPRFLTLGGANIAAMGLGFAVALLVVRQYGAEGLGQLALAQSVVAFLLTASLWGTDLFAIQLVAGRPEKLWPTIHLVRWTRALAASTCYLLVVVAASLIPAFRDVLPLIAILGLSSFVAVLAPEWVPQALHRTGVTAAANFTTQSGYLGLVWLGASVAGFGLWSVAVAKTGADLLVAGGLLVWLARLGPDRGSRPRRADVQALATAAAPICGTQLLRSIALTSDIVILGVLVSRVELGHYSGAARIFMLLLALATAYFVILLPRFAERAASRTALGDELRSSLRLTVPVAVAGVAALAFLATPILVLLFGPEFVESAVPLRLLGAAAAANLVGRHFRQVLLVRGLQGTDFRLTAVTTTTHIVAKLVLIPLFGIQGAAIGTLIGETMLMVTHGMAARQALSHDAATDAQPPRTGRS